MTSKTPDPLDTSSLAEMYDPKELIWWIEHRGYSPAGSYAMFPLCVTCNNCKYVLRAIAIRLGVRYLRTLQEYVERITDDTLEASYQHYIRNGSVDPQYSEGIRVLKDYIVRHKYLENDADTSFFRGMYDPEELIGWLKLMGYFSSDGATHPPLHHRGQLWSSYQNGLRNPWSRTPRTAQGGS